MRRLPFCIVFSALLTCAIALPGASSLVLSKAVEIEAGQSEYQISASPIISGSETVYADSLLLVAGQDYSIDYHRGILNLLRVPDSRYIQVSCILIPPDLTARRYRYEVLAPSDSLFSSLAPRQRSWLADSGKLLISGSKTFAITFSDDAAFDLKQSLFVNLNGELSSNVNIAAQLSDSQSKLTPEGDSKELSSLDKVFIRVFGRQYEIAMGDLEWRFENTRYINYQTNIEGINAWYRDRHYAQAGFTAAGGKPATLSIPVIDGKQGPYYLNPTNFQSTFLIIAGSEQIYRDGILLERGTDYYVDYSDGSVMFRTLVVSSNLINAYVQYADDYYRQTTYFTSSRIQILPGFSVAHHFIQQSDSRDNPLLFAFTPADLDSLRAAGDRLVWGNGVTQVAAGDGNYILVTEPDGSQYFQYAETGSDSLAAYNVTFSYVGTGNGDYKEYSSGKFRYAGAGLGAWLPQKRLVPAVKRANADLSLRYENSGLELGAEGIYTTNDKNTFSPLDDGDNRSGILAAWGIWKSGEPERESYIRIDAEKKWAQSYLFSQSSALDQEYDLALLDPADSLGQYQLDLVVGSKRWTGWNPSLALRFKDVAGFYRQRALRFLSQSTGSGLLPALSLRSTLSAQDYDSPDTPNSLLQYHDLSSDWSSRWWKAKLLLNYNSLEYSTASSLWPGNRYLRVNPQLSIGDAKVSLSQLSFALDSTELKNPTWESQSKSQTYSLKHNTTTLNHSISLDFTHRELQKQGEAPRSNYDLISFRNSHSFFKQAIMFMGNYQLNQTEFYPKIRELDYIGNGLGLYDSTGVYTPDGDYDYVYITSDKGQLSTEINAQLSLYLKPGNYLPAWKRVHSDVLVLLNEQGAGLDDWRSYLFYPGTVFNAPTTIFGKQSYSQTLWLDIVSNRILGNLNLQYDRSLDNRYQSSTRNTEFIRGGELDFKQFGGNNYNLKYEHNKESDTRYMSDITRQNLGLLVQRNLTPSSLLTLNLSAFTESGAQQSGGDAYQLRGLGILPGYRNVWGKKGRISGSLGLRYNQRSGSGFMNFLPEKRAGLLVDWSVSAIYRLNSFSSASLDYSGSSWPGEKIRNSLKLEFKAEL